ncbi:FAD-dependent monooxygenase [Actinopolymorpha singaporensis]|uniref:4,5-epoxidase n=1 Tax=Actinopolymorpha singaporensis TaxID=117157 RepID=A0A1H1P3E5_9ACTN|nr:FAD-dependent monooxygenase [Actinopolymorpha singaporensis]SDS05751.1 4,5-epoxidase [Actinopolymorpha singaporensis]
MTSDVNVLIVGAGPTGLAVACGLLAGGVSVRVLDKAQGPATTSRALGLQPRGTEVLEHLGALGDLAERSVPIERIAIHVGGSSAATLEVGRRTPLVTRPGLLVSQAEVEAALRVRLGQLGGTVEWGREVADITQDSEGVAVTTALPGAVGAPREKLRASWAVGCDGAHSRVRKLAGIGFPGVALIEHFLLADVHADLPIPRNEVAVWLRADRMLGAFPLPGDDLWRLMAPAERLQGATTGEEVVSALLAAWCEHTGLAAPAVRQVAWTSTFRVHRRLADSYRQGRILLAGDAAHIHSPLGGQGMNTGLGDAENLAWKLALVARGRADVALLDTYQDERRPVASEVLGSTSAMTRVVLGDSAPARLIRDGVFVPLLRRSLVQRLIWEQASQLKVGYRRGLLARSTHRRRYAVARRLRAGDRVPDLPCRRDDGTPTRLHAELDGRWVLLGRRTVTGPAADAAASRLGADLVTALEPLDPPPGAILLVRPDGHLAHHVDGADAADAKERLTTWIGRALQGGRK